MADSLVILRSHFIDGKSITCDEKNLIFENGQSFPRNTETIFKQKSSSTPYPLDSIWFLLKNKDLSHGEYVLFVLFLFHLQLNFYSYVKACVNEGISQITRLDRNAIISAITSGDQLVAPATQSTAPSDLKEEKMELEVDSSDRKAGLGIDEVMSQERFLHDRQSLLVNTKKNFQLLLKNIQSYDNQRRRSSAIPSSAPSAQRIVERENQRFTRDQIRPDEFWNAHVGGGLSDVNIADTGGSLATYLSGGQTNTSSTQEEPRRHSDGHKRSSSSSTSSSSKRIKTEKKKPKGNPIIIVPPLTNEHFNRYHAYQFFQNGNYEPSPASQEKTRRKIVVERTLKDGTVEKYEIIDNVVVLEERDWDRVVAAFVMGKDWELKHYKHSTVAEIFHKIRGYYVKLDDSKIPDLIKQWNVKILTLSLHKRHHDQSTLSEFWSDLDDFRSRKSQV